MSVFSIFYQFCVYCSVCARIYSNDIMSFFDEKENIKFVAPSEYVSKICLSIELCVS